MKNKFKEWYKKTTENLRFKVVSFLYDHKLFGIHTKCWADLVIYSMVNHDWESVSEATKCGYCGACMKDDCDEI